MACVNVVKRSFLAVPSGQGKSRIIATVIALLARMRNLSKFAIVFPNSLLASVNRSDFQYLDSLFAINTQIVARDNAPIGTLIDPDRVLLIDEADQILLDDCE